MTKIISKKTAYKGKVTRVDEVKLDFQNGNQRIFELISFNVSTGVSALPVLDDALLLIKHYQVGLDQESYTLPTGGLNQGEDPKERMQLELQEEIGYKAGQLTLMTRLDILPSYIGSRSGYLFLAEDLTPSRLKGDEPYPITLHPFTLKEALAMIRNDVIRDSRTILALLYYARFFNH